jgi:hypothetical protein
MDISHKGGSPVVEQQLAAGVLGTAVFSECGRYRYRLERFNLPGRRTAVICMLNPSKAGADVGDHTIAKLIGFAGPLDIGRWIVVNPAALISTDPKGLLAADDPIGPDNDAHIIEAVCEADIAVVAWGNGVELLARAYPERVEHVLGLLRGEDRGLQCWGKTTKGHPCHPLRLAYTTPLEPFLG